MENSGKIERSAGILMHISSLPSPFGIGTFGKTAYEFVDFVAQARHRYWQVLPLGPTTYGFWGFALSGIFCFCRKSIFCGS